MKQIRLCVERRVRPGRVSMPLRSPWIEDSQATRLSVAEMVKSGNVKWGAGTHWMDERDGPGLFSVAAPTPSP